jgi:hypothetical protein
VYDIDDIPGRRQAKEAPSIALNFASVSKHISKYFSKQLFDHARSAWLHSSSSWGQSGSLVAKVKS